MFKVQVAGLSKKPFQHHHRVGSSLVIKHCNAEPGVRHSAAIRVELHEKGTPCH